VAMRASGDEAMEAQQPLLSGREDVDAALEEGRCPEWWDRNASDMYIRAGEASAFRSAFAALNDNVSASPPDSGRQSPRSLSTPATRKGGGKGATRESRARCDALTILLTSVYARITVSGQSEYLQWSQLRISCKWSYTLFIDSTCVC
jgi:hypothetical protein